MSINFWSKNQYAKKELPTNRVGVGAGPRWKKKKKTNRPGKKKRKNPWGDGGGGGAIQAIRGEGES